MLLFIDIQLAKPFCFQAAPMRIAEIWQIIPLDWMEALPYARKGVVVYLVLYLVL
jgi:hypothetical protein